MNPRRPRRARRMSALQRKYFGPRKGKKRRGGGRTVIVATTNPARRRRRRKMSALQRRYFGKHRRGGKRTVLVAATNPSRKHRRRRHHRARILRVRRNPFSSIGSMSSMSGLGDSFVNAFIGASGALLIDWAWGNVAPSSLQTGMIAPVGRIAAAVLLGAGMGAMMSDKKLGQEVAIGAMTVTVYDIAKTYLQNNMPQLNLAAYVPGLGYLNPAQTVGIYVRGRQHRLGAFVPGRQRGRRLSAYIGGRAHATP